MHPTKIKFEHSTPKTTCDQTEYNKEIKIISCDCGYIFEKYTYCVRFIYKNCMYLQEGE
jgi:hypothetical protein